MLGSIPEQHTIQHKGADRQNTGVPSGGMTLNMIDFAGGLFVIGTDV
jgi:hypothetical protein